MDYSATEVNAYICKYPKAHTNTTSEYHAMATQPTLSISHRVSIVELPAAPRWRTTEELSGIAIMSGGTTTTTTTN